MLKPRFNPAVFEHRGQALLNLLPTRTIIGIYAKLSAQGPAEAGCAHRTSDVAAWPGGWLADPAHSGSLISYDVIPLQEPGFSSDTEIPPPFAPTMSSLRLLYFA